MGSKNLKAIAVAGTGKGNISDGKNLAKLVHGLRKRFMTWSGREPSYNLGMMQGWMRNQILLYLLSAFL